MSLETRPVPGPSPIFIERHACSTRTPDIVLRRAGAKEWEGSPGVWSIPLDDAVIRRANIGVDIMSLPEGYGIVGGAARNVLEAVVHPDTQLSRPRDIDAKFFSEQGGERLDNSREHELSMALSPRDTENGHGISEVSSIREWLRSCDFTLNQSVVYGDMLHTTTNAVGDMINYIIRPTTYEHTREHQLSLKLALKALRLLAELKVDGIEEASIRGINLKHEVYIEESSRIFWHTLNLDKALERGVNVARQYLVSMEKSGMSLPVRGGSNPIEVYGRLIKRIPSFVPSEKAGELLKTPRAGRPREAILRDMGLIGLGNQRSH